jgi:N-acetylglucosamine-6-phosphate deacetylase
MILVTDRLVSGHDDLSPAWIQIESGTVTALGTGGPPAGATTTVAGTIVPGFIDLHAHGALGFDFGRASADEIGMAVAHHSGLGTTTMIASVASGTRLSTVGALRRLAPLVHVGTLAGVHLEGPFLSHAHRGAHNPVHLRLPTIAEAESLLDAADGTLRMVTIAPEMSGAEPVVRRFADAGVVVAIGHSDALAETASASIDWGVSHVTHLFNGMPELLHRSPGPVGVALSDDRLTVELILDGVHVAREAALTALRSAHDRIALVSDASEATGNPDGDYEIAGSRVRVTAGVARLADGSSLAGSTRAVAEGFRRAATLPGLSLRDAVRITSMTPARVLRRSTAGLEPSAPADLVVVDSQSHRVLRVMKGGQWLE